MEISYRKREINGTEQEETTFEFEIEDYLVFEVFSGNCTAEIYERSSRKRIFGSGLAPSEYFFSDNRARKYLDHVLAKDQ